MTATTTRLAPREREVVQGIAEGLVLAEIAAGLRLREGTVKGYCDLAKGKLGAREAPALVDAAYKAGELAEPEPDDQPVQLTNGQRDLLPLIAAGRSTVQMATELHRPVAAVRSDARALLTALRATNPAHAVTRGRQLRLLGPHHHTQHTERHHRRQKQ